MKYTTALAVTVHSDNTHSGTRFITIRARPLVEVQEPGERDKRDDGLPPLMNLGYSHPRDKMSKFENVELSITLMIDDDEDELYFSPPEVVFNTAVDPKLEEVENAIKGMRALSKALPEHRSCLYRRAKFIEQVVLSYAVLINAKYVIHTETLGYYCPNGFLPHLPAKYYHTVSEDLSIALRTYLRDSGVCLEP